MQEPEDPAAARDPRGAGGAGTPPFRDHFSANAAGYASCRPDYPAPFLAAVAACAPGRRLAWDAGTGSGQAARGLAAHFDRIVATDASAAQIAAAAPHPRVDFRVGDESGSGLAPHSADLVTVAQALHWFDRDRFWSEARRVLVPGGVVAAWCYGQMKLDADLEARFLPFHDRFVGPYWPPERALVEAAYRTIEFPFAEFSIGEWSMTIEMTRAAFDGYVATWSALAPARRALGREPLAALAQALDPVWPSDDPRPRPILWPIGIRIGRVDPENSP